MPDTDQGCLTRNYQAYSFNKLSGDKCFCFLYKSMVVVGPLSWGRLIRTFNDLFYPKRIQSMNPLVQEQL